MECFCYLRNIYKTNWQTEEVTVTIRFGTPFDGPVIPLGAENPKVVPINLGQRCFQEYSSDTL